MSVEKRIFSPGRYLPMKNLTEWVTADWNIRSISFWKLIFFIWKMRMRRQWISWSGIRINLSATMSWNWQDCIFICAHWQDYTEIRNRHCVRFKISRCRRRTVLSFWNWYLKWIRDFLLPERSFWWRNSLKEDVPVRFCIWKHGMQFVQICPCFTEWTVSGHRYFSLQEKRRCWQRSW